MKIIKFFVKCRFNFFDIVLMATTIVLINKDLLVYGVLVLIIGAGINTWLEMTFKETSK